MNSSIDLEYFSSRKLNIQNMNHYFYILVVFTIFTYLRKAINLSDKFLSHGEVLRDEFNHVTDTLVRALRTH